MGTWRLQLWTGAGWCLKLFHVTREDWGSRVELIMEELLEADADLILLQEANVNVE